MEHGDHLVDIVDRHGVPIATKPRRDIDKKVDLCHTIFVVLVTPEHRLLLSRIPSRDDLPNLYVGSLGATAATIRRHSETADEASRRVLQTELYLEGLELTKLGDFYQAFPDERHKFMSLYYGVHAAPTNYSHADIEELVLMALSGVGPAVAADESQFAPTFVALWDKFGSELLAGPGLRP
jgi:hypothetical protein